MTEPDQTAPQLFDLVMGDPPWAYFFSKTKNRKIENHYPTMKLADICALKIPAKPDSVLYLWATAPKLQEAILVMAAWGFDYVSSMVWDKQKIGMGYHARGQHELLLIGTRGKWHPPPPSLRPGSVIRETRTQHSKKPEQIYTILERAYPQASKLEMFARHARPNWASWGLEAPGSSLVIKADPGAPHRACRVCQGTGRVFEMLGQSRAAFVDCPVVIADLR